MGLIRKSLNLGTIGLVKPDSKKQRFARAAATAGTQSLGPMVRSTREENREAVREERRVASLTPEQRACERAAKWGDTPCAYCGRPPEHPKHDFEPGRRPGHGFETEWPR